MAHTTTGSHTKAVISQYINMNRHNGDGIKSRNNTIVRGYKNTKIGIQSRDNNIDKGNKSAKNS